METRIPVPTDNVFKFYALFGLLLFVFSCGAFLYVNESKNELVFNSVPELEALRGKPQPSAEDKAKIALLQRKLEVASSNEVFYLKSISVFIALSGFLMIYGFRRWHVDIQPIIDRTAKAQMEIAELQLKKLQLELSSQFNASEIPQIKQKDSAPLLTAETATPTTQPSQLKG